jgi:hypothetical protein
MIPNVPQLSKEDKERLVLFHNPHKDSERPKKRAKHVEVRKENPPQNAIHDKQDDVNQNAMDMDPRDDLQVEEGDDLMETE